MAYKQNDYVIENNIIANTVEGDKNIEVDYAPSNLISRGNVYAPGARFRWEETKHWVTMSFSEWKAATSQDADSKTGRPAFGTRMLFGVFKLMAPMTPKKCLSENWPVDPPAEGSRP